VTGLTGTVTGRPVVNDADLERLAGEAQAHRGPVRGRVPTHVGQRLLHDAVCRQVQPCRQRPAAVDGQIDLEPRVAGGIHEHRQGLHAGLRGEVCRLGCAQHRHDPAHLVQRTGAGGPDGP
jgi:hypothetical protein